MVEILSASSIVVQVEIFGPSLSEISNSKPIPGSGVRISENNMQPSVPYLFQGCKLHKIQLINEIANNI